MRGCGGGGGRSAAGLTINRRGGFHIRPGCSRRRNFPVCRRVFPGSVGRAFTPAAPRQFQNRNVRAAAGSGGMGHPALRPPGWRRPSRLVQNIKLIRRGGIYCARRRVSEANRRAAAALRPEIPPGTFAPPRGSRDDASIVPYRGCNAARLAAIPFGRAFAAVRRGGPWPSRKTLRRRKPGRYRIGPYRGLLQRRGRGFPFGCGPCAAASRPNPPLTPYFSFFSR